MSLKKCKECDGQVATTAKTCPHCGANFEHLSEQIGLWVNRVILVSFIILVFKGCGVYVDFKRLPRREQEILKEKFEEQWDKMFQKKQGQ
jgi:RNA polymerase subunit RPABC4/transcription elongation factor Spt4